jgi:hypothetical protein
MEINSIGEVIAERVLKRSVEGGKQQDVVVRLGKPRAFDDGTGWFSPFEIIGIGDGKVRWIAGVDAFQSLQLVLRMIPVSLRYKSREAGAELFFEEPGDDLGFPEATA